MRLLNVYDFKLESGIPDQASSPAEAQFWSQVHHAVPPYAILSHRWVDDEVTFDKFPTIPKRQFADVSSDIPVSEEFDAIDPPTVDKYASSVYKIAGACQQIRKASEETLRHVWIDTVCIDKSDAQELNIAINSMFQWYENAEVCYVYLSDVSWSNGDEKSFREQFNSSQWFKRGWTLQELLAPRRLEFFDKEWNHIGSKEDLADDISRVAGISREHLLVDFRSASLAQKMSWLGNRETKYVADMSYCMLGILGVGNLKGFYMDTRYGQGNMEFQRLQMELIKKWHPDLAFDESLFAWKSDSILSCGLLAPAPSCFRDCADIVFDPKLAKLRLRKNRPVMGRDNANGIFFDEANNMTFWATRIIPLPCFVLWFACTCGIVPCILVVDGVRQKAVHYRDVKLNCWARGKDGELRVQIVKMEKTEDGTWQRIDCGALYPSSSRQVYPSHRIAATARIPLRITKNPVQLKRT